MKRTKGWNKVATVFIGLGLLPVSAYAWPPVVVSPDGRVVVMRPSIRSAESLSPERERAVKILDVETGKLLGSLNGDPGDISTMAFSPEGNLLATGSRQGVVSLWYMTGSNMGQLARQLEGETGTEVTDLSFSPVSRYSRLVSTHASGDSGFSVLWDTRSGQQQSTSQWDSRPEHIAFSDSGTRFAIGSNRGEIRNFDGIFGTRGRDIKDGEKGITDLVFQPGNDRVLVSGSEDGTVRFRKLNVTGPADCEILNGHDQPVSRVLFTSDGSQILSVGRDGKVQCWNSQNLQRLYQTQAHPGGEIVDAAISPDNRVLTTGGTDRTVKFWDVASGKPLQSPGPEPKNDGTVEFLRFVGNQGQGVISKSSDGAVNHWDVASRTLVRPLQKGRARTMTGRFQRISSRLEIPAAVEAPVPEQPPEQPKVEEPVKAAPAPIVVVKPRVARSTSSRRITVGFGADGKADIQVKPRATVVEAPKPFQSSLMLRTILGLQTMSVEQGKSVLDGLAKQCGKSPSEICQMVNRELEATPKLGGEPGDPEGKSAKSEKRGEGEARAEAP